MSITNSRMTVGSLLATVQTTAETVTSTMQAVNAAVGMANKFVSDAAHRQKIRSTLDLAIFEDTLHQQKAAELAEIQLQSIQWMSQSAEHKTQYELAFTRLAKVLDPESTYTK